MKSIKKKSIIDKYYNVFVKFSKTLEEGNIKNVPEAMIRRNDEARDILKIIEEGCGNKVDWNGDCMYYSSQGNPRYCSTCAKRLKFLRSILK